MKVEAIFHGSLYPAGDGRLKRSDNLFRGDVADASRELSCGGIGFLRQYWGEETGVRLVSMSVIPMASATGYGC